MRYSNDKLIPRLEQIVENEAAQNVTFREDELKKIEEIVKSSKPSN